MEVAKRKMLDDREVEGKRAVKVKVVAAAEDDGGESKKQQAAEAEDEEVEEFYAILKRIRVAVKYFEKGKGGDGGKKAEARPAVARPWSLSFQREDFYGTAEEKESMAAAEEEEEEEEDEDAAAGLDLNAEPDCRRKTGKITSGKKLALDVKL